MNASEVRPSVPPAPPEAAGEPDVLLPAAAIEQALGLSLREALDLARWDAGGDLASLLTRVEQTVCRSVREEERLAGVVRGAVLSRLPAFPDAPPQAGVYAVPERLVRDARRNVLLAGNLTAADGACTGHDGLAAALTCVGVSLVRYDGRVNSWRTTFLRRDYDARPDDPLREVREVLDRRAERGTAGPGAGRDRLSYLLRRGLMAAADPPAATCPIRWRSQ
jgi:hypothetical protein